MFLLYTLNILIAFILIFWPVWISRKFFKLPFINPLSIHVLITTPFELMKLIISPMLLIENGLIDIGYQYAILSSSLYIISTIIGMIVFFKFFKIYHFERLLPFKNSYLSLNRLRVVSNFFLLLFLTFFLLLSTSNFGFLNWINNPREGYQLYRTGQGHWYALSIFSLSVSFYLRCLTKSNGNQIIFIAIFYLFLSYFLGSKGTILWYFESSLIILWLMNYNKLQFIMTFGMPAIFSIMIFNLFLALGSNFEFVSIIEYFDHYINGASYYRSFHNGEVNLLYGEVFLTSFWDYIPRFIYPEKPVVYGKIIINELFFPGQAELTNTPAFGGAVTEFADFGWFGLIFFGFFRQDTFLFALTGYWFYCNPRVTWNRISVATALLLIVMYAPGYGAFFPFGIQLVLTFITLFTLYFFARKSRTHSLLP